MKKWLLLVISCLLLVSCDSSSETETSISGDTSQGVESSPAAQSYSVGYDIGRSINTESVKVDINSLKKGLADGLNNTPKYTNEELQTHLTQFRMTMMEEQQKIRNKQLTENKIAADEFLDKNKSKAGVKTTSTGLQYQVLEQGKGKKPTRQDKVVVHYKGELLDGTVFDSSYERGEPVDFDINRVVPGWTEGLQLMSEGSKYMLYLPPHLAYGERGAGMIGPNSALIFEVELLGIVGDDHGHSHN